MTASPRSKVSLILLCLLLVAGWALAAWLGIRLQEAQESAAPATVVREGRLDRVFREWAAQPELRGAAVGFCVLDADGKTVFASPLAETALAPASALKTVTTGAALSLLGPEFRFETTLAATAPMKADGTLDGDLVLVGSGDPTLTREALRKLADTAFVAGLKSVTGRVLADASAFPENPMNDHWNWGDIGNAYGAGAFGVNVDHNRLAIRFEAGSEIGAPAKLLGGEPVASETAWENHVRTGPAGSGDGVVVYSEPYGRRITLRGTVPLGEKDFTITGAIPDPPALAAEFVRARLESAGVKFAGRTLTAGSQRLPLAVHRSPPLVEIVGHLHRVSDNLEAQALFLAIGRKQSSEPAAAVQAFWEQAGVEFIGWRLLDGSGLARANMIRPLDLARVNLAARRGPQGRLFYESLIAQADGALRAKNGAMSGVRSEVGFLRTAAGRELTFALIANGLGAGIDFWPLRQPLLEAVAASEH